MICQFDRVIALSPYDVSEGGGQCISRVDRAPPSPLWDTCRQCTWRVEPDSLRLLRASQGQTLDIDRAPYEQQVEGHTQPSGLPTDAEGLTRPQRITLASTGSSIGS